jgi:predicted MFS family arabinose efflux permease
MARFMAIRPRDPETGSVAVATPPTEGASPAGGGAFASLRIRDFRLLIGGSLASGFAMWMEAIGQGWLVHELTRSPFQLGFVQFLRGFSILFVSPMVGAIAGWATALNGLNALTVGVLVVTGRIELWHLYVTSFIGGTAGSIYNPVRQHLVYRSVGPESLTNAIALNSGANNVSRVVAPNVSGAMIGFFGVESSFFAESLFFGAAVLSLFSMKLQPVVGRSTESVFSSVRLGVSHLRQHPLLWRLVLLQAVPTFLVYPYLQLMPSMAADYLHVGAQGFGFLQTGVGVGSILMTLIVAQFANVRHKGAIMSLALMAYMSMIVAFSFSRIFMLSFGLLMLGGMNLIVFTTFNQSLLQLNVEDEYRARVISLFTMVQGLNPLGSLVMGSVAEVLGTPHAIALMTGLAIVAALGAGVGSPYVRRL